jgi:hypothetical protein
MNSEKHWLDDDEPKKLMRNPMATHTDYGEFQGLIKDHSNIVPSNVDGILERKGKFLIFEWKRVGEAVSKGQEIMLQTLAKKDGFTVLIIIGNTDKETVIEKFYKIGADSKCHLLGKGFNEFKLYYISWYNEASK